MSIKNVKVRFNLDKGNDRKAYEYLQGADVSYSKAVISAICGYMELSKTKAYPTLPMRTVNTTKDYSIRKHPIFSAHRRMKKSCPILERGKHSLKRQ